MMNPLYKQYGANIAYDMVIRQGINMNSTLLHDYLVDVAKLLRNHHIVLADRTDTRPQPHLVYRYGPRQTFPNYTLVAKLAQYQYPQEVLPVTNVFYDDQIHKTDKHGVQQSNANIWLACVDAAPTSSALYMYCHNSRLGTTDPIMINNKIDAMFPVQLWKHHENISSLARLLISAFRVVLPLHTTPLYIPVDATIKPMIDAAVRHQVIDPSCFIDGMAFLVNMVITAKEPNTLAVTGKTMCHR